MEDFLGDVLWVVVDELLADQAHIVNEAFLRDFAVCIECVLHVFCELVEEGVVLGSGLKRLR